MSRPCLVAILACLLPAGALAQEEGGGRHRLELALGGGLSWISADPRGVDVSLGGQLGARAMLDLVHVRAEAWATMPDPSRPERFQLRGDARLLFIVLHDLTWRRAESGELVRLLAGLGGEVDLPGDHGQLTLSLGFAMGRLGGPEGAEGPLREAYGGYAGAALRLHFWELRDELRVALHATLAPEDVGLADLLTPGQVLGRLAVGFTASNRLYLQALRAGPISLGPELNVQLAQLLGGATVYVTAGLAGTLGL